MSDDSDNDELFNNDDDEDELNELPGFDAPAYTNTDEFKKFVEDQKINLDDKYGYILIHTYKPFYFPGEIIRGSIILDLFNDLPKKIKNVHLRFVGRENVGKYFENVKTSIITSRKKSRQYSSSKNETLHI